MKWRIKKMIFIAILLLCILLPLFADKLMVKAQTETWYEFTAESGDAEILGVDYTGESYAEVNAKECADEIYDHSSDTSIGQSYSSELFKIMRYAVLFDISELSGTILEAELQFYPRNKGIDSTDFNVVIQTHTSEEAAPQNPPILEDYNASYYTTSNLGSISTTDVEEDEWFNITLNTDGLNYLQGTSMARFILRSDRDIGAIEPVDEETIGVATSRHPVYHPTLFILVEEDPEPTPSPTPTLSPTPTATPTSSNLGRGLYPFLPLLGMALAIAFIVLFFCISDMRDSGNIDIVIVPLFAVISLAVCIIVIILFNL